MSSFNGAINKSSLDVGNERMESYQKKEGDSVNMLTTNHYSDEFCSKKKGVVAIEWCEVKEEFCF